MFPDIASKPEGERTRRSPSDCLKAAGPQFLHSPRLRLGQVGAVFVVFITGSGSGGPFLLFPSLEGWRPRAPGWFSGWVADSRPYGVRRLIGASASTLFLLGCGCTDTLPNPAGGLGGTWGLSPAHEALCVFFRGKRRAPTERRRLWRGGSANGSGRGDAGICLLIKAGYLNTPSQTDAGFISNGIFLSTPLFLSAKNSVLFLFPAPQRV